MSCSLSPIPPLTAHPQTYLPDPIPTLPLEKDGNKRILRDMWLEGDVEDSLLALAAELGWLKDLGKYSKQMATGSREKLQAALAQAAIRPAKSAKGGNKKKTKRNDKGASQDTEVVREMKAAAKAVARLILSGKCRRIAFLTGAGCSVGAGTLTTHRTPSSRDDLSSITVAPSSLINACQTKHGPESAITV